MTTAVMANETFTIREEIRVRASMEKTFASLLVQMGRENQTPDGKPLPMVIEPRPGGRWFRDLGSDSGHLWGFVQSIKPPTLLEIFGPLMMSYPIAGHLIVRLTPTAGGTKLVFKNEVFGPIPDDFRDGMAEGWGQLLDAMKRDVEG